jgi:hypothetical protein
LASAQYGAEKFDLIGAHLGRAGELCQEFFGHPVDSVSAPELRS